MKTFIASSDDLIEQFLWKKIECTNIKERQNNWDQFKLWLNYFTAFFKNLTNKTSSDLIKHVNLYKGKRVVLYGSPTWRPPSPSYKCLLVLLKLNNSTTCAIVNQLKNSLLVQWTIFCVFLKQPSSQFIDNYRFPW